MSHYAVRTNRDAVLAVFQDRDTAEAWREDLEVFAYTLLRKRLPSWAKLVVFVDEIDEGEAWGSPIDDYVPRFYRYGETPHLVSTYRINATVTRGRNGARCEPVGFPVEAWDFEIQPEDTTEGRVWHEHAPPHRRKVQVTVWAPDQETAERLLAQTEARLQAEYRIPAA